MSGNPRRVYCFEDDPCTLEKLHRVIDENEAVAARYFDAPGALAAAQRTAPADVAILGGETAEALALVAEIHAASPQTLCLVLSGPVELDALLAAVGGAVFRLTPQPADADDLRGALAEALAALALRDLQRAAGGDLAASGHTRTPVMLLDSALRVIYANDEAADLMQDGATFALDTDETLIAADPAQAPAFRAFLRLAVVSRGRGAPRAFRLSRGPGRAPVSLCAAGAGEGLKLLIADPERKGGPSPASIGAALNIGEPEARVVHGLALGMDIGQAAGAAGLSVAAARAHMRTAFDKTGAARPADLVRLALLAGA
ncbi:helix-turn-helix transcriptional regulator [Amphiplicatus metriothermophilus]|uniref:DNA-binding transcriptional regulator, CsgD family n=1 Tax=Amphiplicatus metriothermophilus TaxID=1519374 RepID=A0A239PU14_9PROT|nr:hypothetical protein [Amphiplicatus metriothermophilus]MBB5519117.1 DNA-binding NarL/FixJ family response regulator [Amphiplicatus metriothermophilus]SNT73187.1 hypothetical protein SAMN06297382_1584 [Amphiplicatus metriothermophilus]